MLYTSSIPQNEYLRKEFRRHLILNNIRNLIYTAPTRAPNLYSTDDRSCFWLEEVGRGSKVTSECDSEDSEAEWADCKEMLEEEAEGERF